ncbi:uncharacterized protein LOC142564856 [Dermacentor variabilis]|uniref:uncharacterized protein LOC142564856 n=1 Tax=Dermacentor variabilis TaxID=34621 RepID=UPI003F5B516A
MEGLGTSTMTGGSRSSLSSADMARGQHSSRDTRYLTPAVPILMRIIEEQVVAQSHTGAQREWGYILALFMLMATGSLVTYVVLTSSGVFDGGSKSKTRSHVETTAPQPTAYPTTVGGAFSGSNTASTPTT